MVVGDSKVVIDWFVGKSHLNYPPLFMLAHNYDWGYSLEEASLGRRKKIQKTHFPKVLRAGASF